MESAPTDSSRSSPVRVTESPGRGSVSKRENPDIVYNEPVVKFVNKEYSKVEAVLEVRKVFVVAHAIGCVWQTCCCKEADLSYNHFTWSKY